jgi:hypothetical protein
MAESPQWQPVPPSRPKNGQSLAQKRAQRAGVMASSTTLGPAYVVPPLVASTPTTKQPSRSKVTPRR